MCETCLVDMGGLEGLHVRVMSARRSEAEREYRASLCGAHKCPECVRSEKNREVQVAPGKRVSREAARAIEDEWIRDGLIR